MRNRSNISSYPRPWDRNPLPPQHEGKGCNTLQKHVNLVTVDRCAFTIIVRECIQNETPYATNALQASHLYIYHFPAAYKNTSHMSRNAKVRTKSLKSLFMQILSISMYELVYACHTCTYILGALRSHTSTQLY